MAVHLEEWVDQLSTKVSEKADQFEDLFEKEFAATTGNHFIQQMIAGGITFCKGRHDILNDQYECYVEVFMKRGEETNEREPLYFVFKKEGWNLLATHLFKSYEEIENLIKKSA